ncbi:MAG: type VI secretion system ImpA family N-terminal domain-containing protein [Pseudomonadota bacterium]
MNIDFESLNQLIDEGTGPDLTDDPVFAQFEQDVEGFLPTRADDYYYSFRAPNADLEVFGKRCLDLLERTRDLRLFVTLAKVCALSGDATSLAQTITLIRRFLEDEWDAVHPAAFSGSFNIRAVSVERLDEFASLVLPLQYAPLVSDRNGNISYRDYAIATGAVIARDEDTQITDADVERTLQRCELETLLAARALTAGLRDDLAAIGLIWSANTEDPPSLTFKRLAPMLGKMADFLEEAAIKRDPSLAEGAAEDEAEGEGGESAEGAEQAATPVGAMAHLGDARAALRAATLYFERFEPSSPALLLARKAEELMGLTFPQLLQQIAPDRVFDTAIQLGGRRNLSLPMEKLTNEFDGIELDRGEEPEPSQTYEAGDRASALTLMSEVGKWYRTCEPSSPIPILLDKARELAAKDFNALLGEITIPEPPS